MSESDESQSSVDATVPMSDTVAERPSARAPAPRSYARGDAIGRYLVLDLLGQGAMGAVYAAFDPELDRRVALKVLHPDNKSQRAKSQGQGRLVREAKAMAQLSHPNVIQVFDVGTLEDSRDVYVAMELIDGMTLGEWLLAEERSWRDVLDVYRQAANGLAHAHAQGVVHRDFKPDNCLIDGDGRVRVIDFGIARRSRTLEPDEVERLAAGEFADLADMAKTRDGMLIGTPAYMSFEQLEGREADERSDQFALCVSIYEALYGKPPFAGVGLLERMVEVMEGHVRPAPEHSPVPEWARAAVFRGLATDADERHPSVPALLEALEPPAPRFALGPWAGVLGLALLGTMGLIGTSLTEGESAPTVCQGLDSHLDGVWDDGRRARLRHAIERSDASHAAHVAETVGARLDAYADSWVEMRTEACTATRIHRDATERTLVLRLRCLDARLHELDTAVTVLSSEGADAADRAAHVVADLAPLSRCADVAALEAAADREPPPAIADRVAELAQESVEVRTAWRAGRREEASEAAEQLLADAREVGWDPAVANALIRRAYTLVDEGHFDDARSHLVEAAWRAGQAGDARAEAEAWITLLFVIGSKLRQREEALRWQGFARSALARAGDEPLLTARLDYTVGLIEGALGRHEVALEHHLAAEEQQRRVVAENGWQLAATVGAQAAALSHLGRADEAIAAYRRSLELARSGLGPTHPSNGSLLNNLAIAFRRAQRFEESRATFEETLELKRTIYGARHPSVALTLMNLGELSRRLGDYQRAGELYEEARSIREETLGEGHPMYIGTFTSRAELALVQGDTEAALPLFREALTRYETLGGAFNVARARGSLAWGYYRAGRSTDAEPLLRQALAHFEDEGVEALTSAHERTTLGAVLVELDRAEEAVAALEPALEAREARSIDPEDVGFTRYALGRALYESGMDPHRGWSLVEASRADFEDAAHAGAWATERVQAWLDAHPRPAQQG